MFVYCSVFLEFSIKNFNLQQFLCFFHSNLPFNLLFNLNIQSTSPSLVYILFTPSLPLSYIVYFLLSSFLIFFFQLSYPFFFFFFLSLFFFFPQFLPSLEYYIPQSEIITNSISEQPVYWKDTTFCSSEKCYGHIQKQV